MEQLHSSVPDSARERISMSRLLKGLERMLPYMIGRDRVRTSTQIMRCLGYTPTATNERLRAAVKKLAMQMRIPIVSCSKGFYIATSVEDVVTYKQSLLRRIQGLNRDVTDASEMISWVNMTERRWF